MYALLGLLAAASTYLLLRVLTGPGSRPLSTLVPSAPSRRLGAVLAYVLAAAAGLYVQYAFALLLLAHNAVFCVWWIATGRRAPDRWRWPLAWVGAQAGILLLYVPWIRIALASVFGWPGAAGGFALGNALIDSLRVLAVGVTAQVAGSIGALAGLALLALIGLAPNRPDRLGWFGIAATALSLALPIALMMALGLYKPAWLKILIIGLPPMHLLVAHGVEVLARAAGRTFPAGRLSAVRGVRLAVTVAVATAFVPSLQNLYCDTAYARDDYRQIAADVAAVRRAGDGIVLNAPNQWEVFTYYYPDQHVHPAPYQPDYGEARDFLNPLIDDYDRLFVLYWGDDESDPQHQVEAGLAAMAFKSRDRWYGRVRLATYALSELSDRPAVEVDAEFGETIHLLGYAVAEGPYARDEILSVTLYWRATEFVPERYKVTLQLLDEAGQLAAQHDSEPGGGLSPTIEWEPGQVNLDRHGLSIGADLSPGRYTLIVALYDPASGLRLPVFVAGEQVGDSLSLQPIDVSS